MTPSPRLLLAPAALALSLAAIPPGHAQQTRAAAAPAAVQPAQPAAQGPRPGALGNIGGNSKDPIKIDSDRLDVFDREGRAVFTGNVVAVQGESTIRCSVLTVTYETSRGGAKPGETKPGEVKPAPKPATARGPGSEGGDNAIKNLDCKGPVTVTSRTQTATGENAVFDRITNKVVMTGNVALTDGPNVTRGDRIVYDMTSGIANVETAGGRVRAMITPGSGGNEPAAPAGGGAKPGPKPAPR